MQQGASVLVGVRIVASMTAVLGSAALTLACLIALVQGTILAVAIEQTTLRLLVLAADFVIGTSALLGCTYLATHLAVRILGVGQAEFPPLPDEMYSVNVSSGDSPKI
jgi:hypothetical protein